MGNWETPYLKARVQFVGDYLNNTPDVNKTSADGSLLKNIELVYGVAATQRIVNHVSQLVRKPRSEILSNFETFSENIIKAYGKVQGKKFLDKMPQRSG